MDKQFITAAISGGLVIFIWSAVSWMALPFHSQTLYTIPEAAIETKTLKQQMPEPGVYHYPGLPEGDSPDAWETMMQKMKEGPVISQMVFLPEGSNPFPVSNYLFGLLFNLLAAGIAVFLLRLTSIHKYWNKVVFVGLIGLFAALSASLPELLWFGYPLAYAVVAVFDIIFGWTLAGLAVAKFINQSDTIEHG